MEERAHHQCDRNGSMRSYKRRIKTQTVLPSAETAAMLFWALPPQVRSQCAKSTVADPDQNSLTAISAEGSTVWVLIRRLNSSWSRSIALVVRALFHWLSGSRVNAKSDHRLPRGCRPPPCI